MKKQVLSILLVMTAGLAMAQSSNCSKIKTIIAEADKQQLQNEAKGDKFQTADEFDAWMATTTLDGASKCYVQDAHVAKMYVAEFGSAAGSREADATLSKKLEELATTLQNCLGTGFMMRNINKSESIYKGYQYDGRSENLNTRIMLLQVYNPATKQQQVFLSIVNDPGK